MTGELVLTEQLAADESLLRSIIDQGVRSDWFIRGGGTVLQVQNQTFSEVVGKSTNTLGRPPLNIRPELVQQPFISLIRKVYDTNKPYQSYERSAYIVCNGKDKFYNLNYLTFKDGLGKTFAVLLIAIDRTDCNTPEQLEQKDFALKSAMNAAQVGMLGKIDMLNGIVTYFETLKSLFELEKDFIETVSIYSPIFESDRNCLWNPVDKASKITLVTGSVKNLSLFLSMQNHQYSARACKKCILMKKRSRSRWWAPRAI